MFFPLHYENLRGFASLDKDAFILDMGDCAGLD